MDGLIGLVVVALTVWVFILTCLLIHERNRTNKIEEALYKYYFDYEGREFSCPKFSTAHLNHWIDVRTQLINSQGAYPLRDVVNAILTRLAVEPWRNAVPAVNEIKLLDKRG